MANKPKVLSLKMDFDEAMRLAVQVKPMPKQKKVKPLKK
jgi:hypothetical protein